MSVRERKRKKLIRSLIYGSIALVITSVLIVLLVHKVSKIFGEKPVSDADKTKKTVFNTPTTEPWDPNGIPNIEHIIASSEVLSVHYEKVKGVGSYEIDYRSEAGEWQQADSKETSCQIPINSGFTYHVRIRSVSPTGQFGPYSEEAVVSAEAVIPVIKAVKKTSYNITFSWPLTRENATYVFQYRPKGETEWHEFPLEKPEIVVGGLRKGEIYEAVVAAYKDGFATLRSEVTEFTPGGTGYADPFYCVNAFVKVGTETKSVTYTAEQGCLGVHCWAQFETPLCSDVDLSEELLKLPGGTAMTIVKDADGNYICEKDGNRFSIYVNATVNDEQKEGWVLGNALFVDLAMIYPDSNPYSVHYDRTNAYSSLFTCGGNGKKVDLKSEDKTRYNPLKAKNGKESLTVSGFNRIKDVTGKALPNYGPREQMPAVLDVALALLTAQRNALDKGYALLIYESYRPNSTSKKVYAAMTENKYFKEEIEKDKKKLTLANGFLDKNYTEAYFIANNSNHNKGIALDLTMRKFASVDELGKEVEMQTKMHTLDYRCDMTYNNNYANTLYSIMTTNTGLVPLVAKQEWWHFELTKDPLQFPCVKEYIFANYKI